MTESGQVQNRALRVAILGATGLVGRTMLQVLEERDFPISELRLFASSRSAGTELEFRGQRIAVQEVNEEGFRGLELALFSAGAEASRKWAPIAASAGALVIDNSSAWRMDPEVPLCIPEVNLEAARKAPKRIIANPNCATIQMLVALAPLHREAKIRQIVVATYQAASGAGQKLVKRLEEELRHFVEKGQVALSNAPERPLACNLLMEWKRDVQSHHQEEELKLINETRKILGDPSIIVSPTTVRVPVFNGHAEAIHVEFERPITAQRAREILEAAEGVQVVDEFAKGIYPTPIDADGQDLVLVGRIREALGKPNALSLWVVADNLRKGAATNAIQIAEALFSIMG
ncbi:MAG: aspartate-semialdehyde dehydrogenase [Sandaracinaceae bacterium]|nr:aspartate-semialdehyde dehydrogenase [Sandaracinaceae bacterium]